jgi:hypothetical protein
MEVHQLLDQLLLLVEEVGDLLTVVGMVQEDLGVVVLVD